MNHPWGTSEVVNGLSLTFGRAGVKDHLTGQKFLRVTEGVAAARCIPGQSPGTQPRYWAKVVLSSGERWVCELCETTTQFPTGTLVWVNSECVIEGR